MRSAKDFTVQLSLDADASLPQVKQQLSAIEQALALREGKQCKLVIVYGAQWATSYARTLQLLPRYLRGAGASATHLVIKGAIGELVHTAASRFRRPCSTADSSTAARRLWSPMSLRPLTAIDWRLCIETQRSLCIETPALWPRSQILTMSRLRRLLQSSYAQQPLHYPNLPN